MILENETLISKMRLFSNAAAVMVFGIGSLGFAGWLLDVEVLRRVVPGFESMKANTAVGLLLAGCCLWLLNSDLRWLAGKRIARTLAFVVAVIGFLTIIEYAANADLGIDQFLFRDLQSASVWPGRMSVVTALNFLLIGFALFFLDVSVRGKHLSILPLFVLFTSFVAIVAYAYGVRSVYQVGSFTLMAIHTATAFFLLSLGVLHARPTETVMKVFVGVAPGSTLIRRVLPVSVLVTLIVGWLRLRGEEAGLYQPGFGVALFAVTNILVLTLLLWWSAVSINKADEAIRNAEKRYRTTLDQMMEGGQIIGFDWRYLYLNDVAAAQGRRPREELLGRTMMEMYPGIDQTPFFTILRKCMEERTRHVLENEFDFPDGAKGWFYLSIEPVPEGAFILSVDITNEKRLSEELKKHQEHLEDLVKKRTADLEAANKELDAFSHSVSHDLRSPLRHVDGFIDLLRKQIGPRLDEEGSRYLSIISESAKRMGSLIDDLLSFSRTGRVEMLAANVDVKDLVNTVISELKTEWGGRKVDWVMKDLPVVKADPSMLRLVFVNLLSNALKFTRTRPASRIEIGWEKKETQEMVFFVRDNGVGFETQYADKLFGVFQRLHRAEEFEGTGIGLANVRRIISRHGGKTWAESILDKGATFYFTLPAGKEE